MRKTRLSFLKWYKTLIYDYYNIITLGPLSDKISYLYFAKKKKRKIIVMYRIHSSTTNYKNIDANKINNK